VIIAAQCCFCGRSNSQPASAFADVEPLFTEQERLLEAEDWDGAERLWADMHSQMTLLHDDEAAAPISEFLLRIEGDEARLRY
jgi:hypothetical protein